MEIIIAVRKSNHRRNNTILAVTAYLTYLEGNAMPYFSCTANLYGVTTNGRAILQAGGCMHEEILRYAPEYAQAVALHLADGDGVPMYAVENGWYWLGGTKWQERDNKALAEHLRITEAEAARIQRTTKEAFAAYVDTLRPRWNNEAQALLSWLKGGEV